MLTPEVIDLCKQAEVETNPEKLLEQIRHINRLMEERRVKASEPRPLSR